MNKSAGFSLVEVMCAVLILGIGLAGLTEGVTLALSSSKESEMQSAAALLAAGQIELVRADGYIVAGESEGDGEGDLDRFRWKQTITETKTEGLFEVTVIVEQASTGQEVYELKTMLFDPPLIKETQPSSRDRQRDRDRERRRS